MTNVKSHTITFDSKLKKVIAVRVHGHDIPFFEMGGKLYFGADDPCNGMVVKYLDTTTKAPQIRKKGPRS